MSEELEFILERYKDHQNCSLGEFFCTYIEDIKIQMCSDMESQQWIEDYLEQSGLDVDDLEQMYSWEDPAELALQALKKIWINHPDKDTLEEFFNKYFVGKNLIQDGTYTQVQNDILEFLQYNSWSDTDIIGFWELCGLDNGTENSDHRYISRKCSTEDCNKYALWAKDKCYLCSNFNFYVDKPVKPKIIMEDI